MLVFLGSVILAVREHRRVFALISRGSYYKLLGIFILSIIVRYVFSLGFPQVFNDEFYYLATGENLARNRICTPLIERSFPPKTFGVQEFAPPYPQGWPVMLAVAFRAAGRYSYDVASKLSMILSWLIPVIVFFGTFFLFEGISVREDSRQSGEICGLFAALIWAVLPVVIKITGCASTEIASVFFIAFFTAMLFLYYRYPSFKTFLAMASSLALAINFRPENILYILLLVPVFMRRKFRMLKDSGVVSIIVIGVYALISLLIMNSGRMDPYRVEHFSIIPRTGFSSVFSNFSANLANNFLFLFGRQGIHPVFLTLLFVGGLYYLIGKKQGIFQGVLLLAWWLFFYLVLSPFPFGDFANVNSQDAFRFSTHIYFPVIFASAYCCYAILTLSEKWKIEKATGWILVLVISMSLFLHLDFLRRIHPFGPYYKAMQQLVYRIPENSILIQETPEKVLAVRYASSLPVFLVAAQSDVDGMDTGDRNIFIFSIEPISDLLLENFSIEVFSRHRIDEKEFSILKVKKLN